MTYESVLTALADPTRRQIFEDLRAGPMAVTHLAESRAVSRPAVSQHLKVLQKAGLVSATARGTSRLYAVEPQGLAPLRDYLDTVWGDVLSAFAQEVKAQMQERSDTSTWEQET